MSRPSTPTRTMTGVGAGDRRSPPPIAGARDALVEALSGPTQFNALKELKSIWQLG